MTSISIQTKLDYDWSNSNLTPEAKIKLITRYENMFKDYTGWLNVTLTTDGTNNPWFKIAFYTRISNIRVEFQYSDKKLFLTNDGYTTLRDSSAADGLPFYNHPLYDLLSWLCNDGSEVKMNLMEAVTFVETIRRIHNQIVMWRSK